MKLTVLSDIQNISSLDLKQEPYSTEDENGTKIGATAINACIAWPSSFDQRIHIVTVIPQMTAGGGRTAAISNANGLAKLPGIQSTLLCVNSTQIPEVRALVSDQVAIVYADKLETSVMSFFENCNVKIVHSHLWPADKFICDSLMGKSRSFRWVSTQHGHAEKLHARNGVDDDGFASSFETFIEEVDHIAHVADKNLNAFQHSDYVDAFERRGGTSITTKVVNGLEEISAGNHTKESIGLDPKKITLCIASRAFHYKGWNDAVEAVIYLNKNGYSVQLLLLGEGPEKVRLEEKVKKENIPNIIFLGHVKAPQEYFHLVDIILLPTTFSGESMPMGIIDAYAKGLPVISTNVGDIPQMIGVGEDKGGILIHLEEDGTIDNHKLREAIINLLDKEFRAVHSCNARAIYETKYTTQNMTSMYMDMYKEMFQTYDTSGEEKKD